MARSRHSEGASEEREASDDGSVEEITEEDFKQDGGRGRSGSRGWPTSTSSHVGLMGGYSRYINRNYASTNLYNFAWAQAVQNKPLGITGQQKQEEEEEEVFEVADSGDEEKEEGELEEGEIDGDDVAPPADDISPPPSGDMEVEGAVRGKEEETVAAKDIAALSSADGKEQQELVLVVSKQELGLGSAAAEDIPAVAVKKEELSWDWGEEQEHDINAEPEDFDQRVNIILEKLETVTEEEVENSYKGACSRLLRSLESLQSLQKMVLECNAPLLEAVVQTAFDGVKTIQSAYLKKKEQNEGLFARFLAYIKRQEPAVFAPEQMKEMNEMMPNVIVDTKENDRSRGPSVEPMPASSAGAGSGVDTPLHLKVPKLEPLVTWNRLLDPRANLDEDSLPSPTRENAQPAFNQSKSSFRDYPVVAQSAAIKSRIVNHSAMPSYVTDAYKAVSRYQQKYDRISFMTSNDLPSPTPSGESNDLDADSYSDVSSSVSSYTGTKNMKTAAPTYLIGQTSNYTTDTQHSTSMHSESSRGFNVASQKVSTDPAYGMKPLVKGFAKSRDPRLRLANSNLPSAPEINKPNMLHNQGGMIIEPHEDLTQNSRKNKVSDGLLYENYSSKRQRNGVSGDSQVIASRGGLLEGNDIGVTTISGNGSIGGIRVEYGKQENGVAGSSSKMEVDVNSKGTISEGNHLQATTTVPSISLPFTLTEMAVNPLMLVHLIKEQQRLAAESQLVASSAEVAPNSSSMIKVGTQVSSSSTIPVKDSAPYQKLDAVPPSPTKTAAMTSADPGRIRMKPRDPRRVLQNNSAVRKSGIVGDRLIVREQAEQAQNSGFPSQNSSPPDISQQLTSRLNNATTIVSSPQVSQPANAAAIVTLSDAKPTPIMVDEISGPGSVDAKVLQSSTPPVSSGGSASVASQSADPWGDVDHLLEGYDDKQKAAIQRERARRIEEQNKMFAARKLCLVLDLDHTLLNSAKFTEVEPIHDEILRKKEEQDREKPQRHLYRFQHMGMWTKLRPGIWNFLEKASKLFELHLYTMGNHLYATEMAKVLDPTGSLFNGRVISRGDDNEPFGGDERIPKSKDLEGVLGMESAVVIIDDSVKVWPHNRLNLIVVERYTYFPCSRRQFGLLGPSLLEIDHDERPEDGTLASSLAVIERIHQNFFAHTILNNVDVRNILASEQRKILAGCRIVFSRIFPVGEANPHLHPLWQTAEQFGASCTNQIDDQVTHVVANSLGTDKVNWALSTGRFVVHPGWVEASALLYRRANEQDFAVKL